MRIVVVGGRAFGKAVAHRLSTEGHEIVGVWTPPGNSLEEWAVDRRVPVLRLNELAAADIVDVLVSAHNHQWIPDDTIALAKFGCIGYHPSLLPRHRGKDAIRWTIHMGDPIAGGTVYRLEGDEADTGPILFQDWCHVRPEDDASSLWKRELFGMGVELLAQACRALPHFPVEIPQDEAVATWEPAFDRPKLKETK